MRKWWWIRFVLTIYFDYFVMHLQRFDCISNRLQLFVYLSKFTVKSIYRAESILGIILDVWICLKNRIKQKNNRTIQNMLISMTLSTNNLPWREKFKFRSFFCYEQKTKLSMSFRYRLSYYYQVTTCSVISAYYSEYVCNELP